MGWTAHLLEQTRANVRVQHRAQARRLLVRGADRGRRKIEHLLLLFLLLLPPFTLTLTLVLMLTPTHRVPIQIIVPRRQRGCRGGRRRAQREARERRAVRAERLSPARGAEVRCAFVLVR